MEYVEGKTLCEYVRASGPRMRAITCHDLDNILDCEYEFFYTNAILYCYLN